MKNQLKIYSIQSKYIIPEKVFNDIGCIFIHKTFPLNLVGKYEKKSISHLPNEEFLIPAIVRKDLNFFIQKAFNSINPGMPFLSNWHLNLIAEVLTLAEKSYVKRVIINMPPRSLKSVCISSSWPAWLLGRNPALRIMSASYTQFLSNKLSLDCKMIIESNWYKAAFPKTQIFSGQNTKSKFMTTKNGFRFSTSVGGSATGEGGDFLIIDDPHNPSHVNSKKGRHKVIDWYEQTFSTRLNDKKKGVIVLIMQRLHPEDLSGYLLSKGRNIWHHLELPAEAEKNYEFRVGNKIYYYKYGGILNQVRESKVELSNVQTELGVTNYYAQYIQEPTSYKNSLFDISGLQYYSNLPTGAKTVYCSWDTAYKTGDNNDYSVCTTWADYGMGVYYLLNINKQKLTYPQLKKEIINIINIYKPQSVIIEDKASGQSLIDDLRASSNQNIVPFKPKGDKITRFLSISELLENGRVLFPKNSKWSQEVIDELTAFPNAKHDDTVDSISQFLSYIKQKSKINLPRARII